MEHVETLQSSCASSLPVPVIDVETQVEESRAELPAVSVPDVPAVSPPVVTPQVASPEWAALSQLFDQIVQHQTQIQQQLSKIWDRVGSNSAMSNECSVAGCNVQATLGCVATACPQHCSSQSCPGHRTGERAVCEHDACRNLAPKCLLSRLRRSNCGIPCVLPLEILIFPSLKVICYKVLQELPCDRSPGPDG